MKQQAKDLYYYKPARDSLCLAHFPVHRGESHREMLGLEPKEQLAAQKFFSVSFSMSFNAPLSPMPPSSLKQR